MQIFIWVNNQPFYYNRNKDRFELLPFCCDIDDDEDILMCTIIEATAKAMECEQVLKAIDLEYYFPLQIRFID